MIGIDNEIIIGTSDYGANRGVWAVTAGGDIRWQYDEPIRVIGSPAVGVDGSITFGAADHRIFRVDQNGVEQWVRNPEPTSNRDVNASALIHDDGTALIGRQNDGLYSFDPNGAVNWNSLEPLTVARAAALSHDGSVMVRGRDPFLYCLDPNGGMRWQFDTGYSDAETGLYSGPSIAADGTIYITSLAGEVIAVNVDGTEKWRSSVERPMGTPAIDHGGRIFVATESHALHCFDPNGQAAWVFQAVDAEDRIHRASAVVSRDGTAYTSLGTATMYAIRPNGTLLWSYPTSGLILGAAAIGADGSVYFGSDDGNLFAIGTPVCEGDLTGDGLVGLDDLASVLADFGCSNGACAGDTNLDGDTDLTDLATVLGAFGNTCP